MSLPNSFLDDQGRRLTLTSTPARSGSQAEVYQARRDNGRLVAVKLFFERSDLSDAERDLIRRIAADDPSASEWLVVAEATGTVQERPFLVLPWMDHTLGSWAKGRPLGDRLAALASLADAVARLHRSPADLAGFRVHRDIKPANVLVDQVQGRWRVRLTDLGVAKEGVLGSDLTNTAFGTPSYAPPEQWLPNARATESWDVHAVAVTACLLLTGTLPGPARESRMLLRAEGTELLRLRERRFHGPLAEQDRARYQELSALPAERLLDFDAAVGWTDEDDAAVARALAAEEGARVTADLQRAFAGALVADPRHRDRDMRRLLAALRDASAMVPPTPIVLPPTPPRALPWRQLALASLVLAIGLVSVSAVAAVAWWSGDTPAPGVEAALVLPSAPAEPMIPAPTTGTVSPLPSVVVAPAPAPKPKSEPTKPPSSGQPALTSTRPPVVVDAPLSPEPTPPVPLTVRACSRAGSIAVDGGGARPLNGTALTFDVQPGSHTLRFAMAEGEMVVPVHVGADGARVCRDFVHAAGCSCPD